MARFRLPTDVRPAAGSREDKDVVWRVGFGLMESDTGLFMEFVDHNVDDVISMCGTETTTDAYVNSVVRAVILGALRCTDAFL